MDLDDDLSLRFNVPDWERVCAFCEGEFLQDENPHPWIGGDWNATVSGEMITGLVCPSCQSPDEYVEAESNLAAGVVSTGVWIDGLPPDSIPAPLCVRVAALDYGVRDALGRLIARPRFTGQDQGDEDIRS